MSETLARAIIGMTSADSEVRVVSATEIYRTGRALTDHAVYPWWAEAELAALLEAPNPFVTVGLAVTPERFAAIHEASSSPRMADVPGGEDARGFGLHLPGGA